MVYTYDCAGYLIVKGFRPAALARLGLADGPIEERPESLGAMAEASEHIDRLQSKTGHEQ